MAKLAGPPWDKHAIKAEVHRRGQTLVGLARKAQLELSACKVALHRRHRAGEAAISEFLEVAPAVLWPDRYSSAIAPTDFTRAPRPAASRKRTAA